MAAKIRSRAVINISQSHLSSPREIPESQNAFAPVESPHQLESNTAVSAQKLDKEDERLQKSPAGSVATTRIEDSYKNDAPVANGSIVTVEQSRQPDGDELYNITPEQKHKSQSRFTDGGAESALAGTIPGMQPQAQTDFANTQKDHRPGIEEATVRKLRPRRTPSNLRAVAQQALDSDTDVQRQDHLPTIDQAAARTSTSSNTSAERKTSGRVPGATSQTSAAPTSVLRKVEGHHDEMAGTRAADRLRARQPNAGGASAAASIPAAQETRPAQSTSSRTAGAPVKVTKTNVTGKSGAVSQKAATPAPQKGAVSSTRQATPAPAPTTANSKGRADPAPTPAPKSTAKTRMLGDTPAVSNKKTNATAEPEARHEGGRANRHRGGKKRETVGPDTMQTKLANGPFHFESDDVADSDYDIPISSPKGKAQAKGKKQALREPMQKQYQTSVGYDSINVAGKLPKVSSSQPKAAKQQVKSTGKLVRDDIERRKPKKSSELELAQYSEADASADSDPAPIGDLHSKDFHALSAANSRAPEREHQHDVHVPDRPVELQDAANALNVPGSRQNPQVLSDPSDSSSLPTDPVEKVLKPESAVKAKDFATPTAFRSSPPRREQAIAGGVAEFEQQTARSHKTTIIAFDKSGPRNQGRMPIATPGAKSARSSMPPTKAYLSAPKAPGDTDERSKHRSKQQSSTRISTRTRKAQHSNTSRDVADAFQDYFGKRINSASQSDGVLAKHGSENASSNHNKGGALAGEKVSDQNDEFVDINDYDDAGDLRPSQHQSPAPERQKPKTQNIRNSASVKPTASEEIIETVNDTRRNKDEGRHLRETKAVRSMKDVEPRALSKDRDTPRNTQRPSQRLDKVDGDAIAEEDKDRKSKSREEKAKSLPSHRSESHVRSRHTQIGSTSNKSRPPAHKSKQKDQTAVPDSPALESSSKKMPPPPPRTKGAATITVTRTAAPPVEKTAASSRPKRGIAVDLPSEQAPKRVKLSTVVEQPSQARRHEATPRNSKMSPKKQAGNQKNVHAGAQAKRLSKRTLRQVSQGSQTVDMHGSPVPPDMDVAETKTVLETFSQQASISSDRAQDALPTRQTPYHDDVDLSEEDPFIAPPSHQRKVMSSNAKPVPAEPEADSTALYRVKVTEAQSRMLYGEIDAPEDIANEPSTSQERDDDDSESQERIPSAAGLLRTLNDYFHDHRKVQSKRPGEKNKSPEKVPSRNAVQRAKKPASPSTDVRPAGIRKKREAQPSVSAVKTSRSKNKLFEYTAPVAEEEDPDKTLVNEESSTPGSYVQKSPHHAAIDPGSEASSEDLVEWTGLLKPHQRSFFDGLVRCAQGLTNHFVKQENATDQMLEEYHRRNMYLVQQEEQRQAKYYKDLLVLHEQKSQARNARLLKMSQDVRGLADDFKHEMQDYKARNAADREYNYELEAYIEGL